MHNTRNRHSNQSGNLSRREFLINCAAGAVAVGLAPTALAAAMGAGPGPAVNASSGYCRFSRLAMRDYGVFRGFNELHFTPGLNVILGHNGSGKTTMLEALANPDSPPAPRAHLGMPNPRISVDVDTLGNPDLLRRHRDLVFLDEYWCSAAQRDSRAWRNSALADQLADEAKDIFLQFVPYRESALKQRNMKDVLVRGFGAGETQLAALSYAFAARNALDLDLPLVMERPFSMLDCHHGEKLASYISQLPNQVILLMTESELSRGDGFQADWILSPQENYSYSRILRTNSLEIAAAPA
jgi:hypothetical protein